MRIDEVRIRNFRAIHDLTVPLGDLNCLIGPNGAGKSTVLQALNVFFGIEGVVGLDVQKLTLNDFHHRKTAVPVEITVVFGGLSPAAIKDLGHYARSGRLIVTARARFDEATGCAPVEHYGKRLGIREFASFFAQEKGGAKVAELKQVYARLREKYTELPPSGTKATMVAALREYERQHSEDLVEIESRDQFYGATKGRGLLDAHFQWVYVPPVREASTEGNEGRGTALGQLLARTVRRKLDFSGDIDAVRRAAVEKYAEMMRDHSGDLESLSEAITAKLRRLSGGLEELRLSWDDEDGKAVKVTEPTARALVWDGVFKGPVSHFGHGVQRLFLVALLQELAEEGAGEEEATLVLGIEEPELYQHPPMIRQLRRALRRLSEEGAQVIAVTHSPIFVSGVGYDAIRVIRRPETGAVLRHADRKSVGEVLRRAWDMEAQAVQSGVLAKLQDTLQPRMGEMYFAEKVVLVEGPTDVAFIVTYMELLGQLGKLVGCGGHIVPVGGKENLVLPVAVLRELGVPFLVMMDGDTNHRRNENQWQATERANKAVLRVVDAPEDWSEPEKPIIEEGIVIWPTSIDDVVWREILESIGEKEWEGIAVRARRDLGCVPKRKNPMCVARKLESAWAIGGRSETLERVCMGIVETLCGDA